MPGQRKGSQDQQPLGPFALFVARLAVLPVAPIGPRSLRAPGNRRVDQGAGLGRVHREAAERVTLVVGAD